jgi:putative transposase
MTKIERRELRNKTLQNISLESPEKKLILLKHYAKLMIMLVNDIMEDEVRTFTGERYKRAKPNNGKYSRWGYNPGSIVIGQEKVPIDVPRVIDNVEKQNITLENYQKLKENGPDEEELLKGVLLGLSTSDYGAVVNKFIDGFGLSRSSISNRFIEESAERLKLFNERDLSSYDFTAIMIDGKYLSKEMIVIVLGVTLQGDKIPLGFIQTTKENSRSIGELLTNIVNRGFKYEDGILCVIDGSKGIHKAVEEVFGDYGVIKRCQWHKRENILSYLSEQHKTIFKRKLDNAYNEIDYETAKIKLYAIRDELLKINKSAANSLEEGFEEVLTLHRLGLYEKFSTSFATTNLIENLNSQLRKYIGRVKYWKTSDQRHRWVACGLLEIEQKMRKVNNYLELDILKETIKIYVQSRIINKN